jgi:hypothetical protein
MTLTWGTGRSFGPISRREKPVGNDFTCYTNDAITGSDAGSGTMASADGGSGSPIAIGTSVVTLNVPDQCVEVVLCGDAAFIYSMEAAMNTYFRVPADTVISIGVATRNAVYVATLTSTSNLSIKWVLV